MTSGPRLSGVSPHQTRQYTFDPRARHEGAAALSSFCESTFLSIESVIIKPSLPPSIKQRRYWNAPHGSALALALAETGRAHAGLVVAVARDTHAAHALETELAAFAGADLDVLHFPDWETLPYDLFAPHPDIVSQRIATLYRLPSVQRGVLIVPVATLMQRLAPTSYIAGSGLVLALRQKLELAAEQRRLETSGYRHVPQVAEPGDFAVRGALIDIFPMGSPEPYRIELFDEEIESIRTFDPETQRSENKVESVRLLPAREFPLTDESTKAFRNTLRERFPIDPRRCPLYQDIREGVTPAGIEYYLPLFFDRTDTLFDYLAGTALFVLGEGVLDAAEHFWSQANERYEQRAHDVERPILPVAELYLPPQQLRERLNAQLRVDIVAKGTNENAVDLGTQPAPMLPINRKSDAPADELKRFLAAYPGRVLITADSAGRREALLDLLAIAHLQPTIVGSWSEFVATPPTRRPSGSWDPSAVRS
jgi:transcription-repair coupling factor (superfamily II helicase)